MKKHHINHNEIQYLNLLHYIVLNGNDRGDRTGTGTRSIFGAQMRFDLSENFPLLTTKRVFWKGVVAELLWMLSGSTNIKPLVDQGVHIWDEWADDNGDLGPVYGAQWRDYQGTTHEIGPVKVDQIANVIESIKNNPLSRRHIVSAWNPAEIDHMALPPCHLLFQFYCEPLTLEERYETAGLLGPADYPHSQLDIDRVPSHRLSCQLYQRSGDMFLGVPFNIASYALLTHMVAAEANMLPGEFVHTLGDAHIYLNHFDAVHKQLARDVRPGPQLKLAEPFPGVLAATADDIELTDYNPAPAIKAPVAV